MELSSYYFKKSIDKYGKDYVAELVKQLILAEKKATGELIQSISYTLLETANGIILKIIGKGYLEYVDRGRKAGLKQIPGPVLAKWAKLKEFGLTHNGFKYKNYDQVGWAISKGIQKKGIVATNVLEHTRTNIMNNKVAMDELIQGGYLDIKVMINDYLGQILGPSGASQGDSTQTQI